jgi:deoxyribonuclease-4
VIRACRIRGADGAQVFLSNPRAWASPRFPPERAQAFREAWSESELGPLVAHAPYLVNIASSNPEFLDKSRALAVGTAETCDALGVDALVVHAGSGTDFGMARRRAVETIDAVVGAAGRTRVLVELMAGTKGAVASTIDEASVLLDEIADGSVGICLDTCHLFAAGYAIDTLEGVTAFFHELRGTGLIARVGLVHANDSAFPRGERRDRHAAIGQGHIGEVGFGALLSHPEAADWTFVIETPDDLIPHADQIARLRALAPAG